jgi:prophage regulatory protein
MAVWKLPRVIEETGLSRATIYAKIQRREFVIPIKLSVRSIGFYDFEVIEWLQSRSRSVEDPK